MENKGSAYSNALRRIEGGKLRVQTIADRERRGQTKKKRRIP